MVEPTIIDRKPNSLTLEPGTDQQYSCGLSSTQTCRNGSHKVFGLGMTPSVDSATLLICIAASDQSALSELYNRYARIIYAIAGHSLQSAEESEAVVLEVFAQVWRIADRYDPVKIRADTWLFMLVHSCVLDRLQQIQGRTPISEGVLDITEI